MRPKNLYLILCLAGTLVAYSRFMFFRQQGANFWLFLDQLYSTRGAGLFGMEMIVSSAVLWVFIYIEGRRSRMKRLWVPVAASLLVGISLGLPLFLYMRETRIQGSMFSGGRCEA